MDALVAAVTMAAILFYFWTIYNVGLARRASGISAPAMTGHDQLDRAVRVQTNTLEWMPIFLPLLWLFAVFIPHPYGAFGASALGVVWILGRYLYMTGYMTDPANRSTGFMIQAMACVVLLVGALGGSLWSLAHNG